MVSGRKIKLVFFELLEFAAFSVPTLVLMEQFAAAYQKTRNGAERTHYWLIVSCSIAYVAAVSLLIWVPIKVILFKKRHLYKNIVGWNGKLYQEILLEKHRWETMVNGLYEQRETCSDDVCGAHHSSQLQLFHSSHRGYEDENIYVTSLQQIKTVAEQVKRDENPVPAQTAKPTMMSLPHNNTDALAGPIEPYFDSGFRRTMSHRDVRAELFLRSFLTWSDTIEMMRVAGLPEVYSSGWVYPVYIFSFISLLRMVFTPKNPLLGFLGVLLQDFPFIFLRLSLIVTLGTITPVLGLCKNILVTISYIYFNHLTKLRPFSAFETSPF
ncbi:hypothetical protein ACRRTK_017983 [Alexandromys fortis]